MTPIAPLIEAFLDETLARQRGVSRHTRDSYALSFQLLFMFAAKRLKVSPSALPLEQIDAGWSAPSWSISRIRARTRRKRAMSGWQP
jgi:hypothetical protein